MRELSAETKVWGERKYFPDWQLCFVLWALLVSMFNRLLRIRNLQAYQVPHSKLPRKAMGPMPDSLKPLRHNMKHLNKILSLLTTALAISAVATPTLSTELNQAVIRTVYDEDTTKSIAKSLAPRVITSAGDRLAVVQYSGGAWAVALVPCGLDVCRRQVVELVPDDARTFDSGKMVIVKMLTHQKFSLLATHAVYANGS